MKYYQKYLKYKQKYLSLKKYGGYIKGSHNIEELSILNTIELKSKLNEYMPLCSYDSNDKTNFILVDVSNYILINKKLDGNYKLYKLTNNFDIIEISKLNEIIEDNIIIPGINKMVNGINLIQAFQYNNDNIFRDFLLKVWQSGYPFFNRLKDIIYKNFQGQILYQNNINIVLSIIFINKLDYVISLLDKLDILLLDNSKNYYNYTQTKPIKNFNDIKTDLLFDYINKFDYLMIDSIQSIDTFEKLQDKLNNTFSNIKKLNFQEQNDEFNTFMKILNIIYKYIDTQPNIIDQYNYSLYIDKYKDFDVHPNKTSKKSLINFIKDYNNNTIKNKLALKLSSLIYLCYKTNIELGISYKASQYMLLDYFYGITKIINNCVPINKRQILLKILEISESNELRKTNVTDRIEQEFYRSFTQKFKQIKQYTFLKPIRYTDCGETTILNLFNYFLLNDNGSFNISNTWDEKLQNFYNIYPTMDKMINTNIDKLKQDLSEVFNGRNEISYHKSNDKCEIETTMKSMANTCAILLNIERILIPKPIDDNFWFADDEYEPINFIDIFKKLNNKVKDQDIVIENDNKIKYLDVFTLDLQFGHAEFNLIFNKIIIPGIDKEFNNNLKYHWINNFKLFPTKYSLEHFKFYLTMYSYFFTEYFPSELQTEEFCIEAIRDKPKNISRLNYNHVKTKTYKISTEAVLVNYEILKDIPKELLDKNLYLIAFNSDPLAFKIIPHEFIDKELCDLAFRKNVVLFEFIPHEFQDNSMIINLTKYDLSYLSDNQKDNLFKAINPTLLNKDIYKKLFEKHVTFIKYIPFEFQDKDMFYTIKSQGREKLLNYVDPKLKD
jgi:hypothetical protein